MVAWNGSSQWGPRSTTNGRLEPDSEPPGDRFSPREAVTIPSRPQRVIVVRVVA